MFSMFSLTQKLKAAAKTHLGIQVEQFDRLRNGTAKTIPSIQMQGIYRGTELLGPCH